jgi:FkbM family methyltransferase
VKVETLREMAKYKHNKLLTALDIVRHIENWPAAWGMRISRHRPGLRLLRFRNGMNLICRGGTRDWDVVHELFFAQSYGRAFQYLSTLSRSTIVLDLGGNIGLFSLLSAQSNPLARVHVFEPGPPNLRILEMNRLANPELGERIYVHREAVGGATQSGKWFFDESNPGGSSLFGKGETGVDVQIRAFAEVVEKVQYAISLVKIDIEGGEYDILEKTPPEIWQRIPAISLELHDDPQGRISNDQFLYKMKDFGYRVQPERVCSFLLTR